MNKLDAIFTPQSLAVIGASKTSGKVGHDIFVNILKGGDQGTLYPVNPKARSISSVKAYPAIADIPDSVDLAMIVLPHGPALAATEEAIEKSLVSLSNTATIHPEIMELDINPLLVRDSGHGATAADCRIVLKKPED